MIERDKARKFVEDIEKLWDVLLPRSIARPIRDWTKSQVMGEAISELRKLVLESRPPVMFLLGRSGHGKSSLINALCGQPVAAVGDVKPQTPQSDKYHVLFNEGKSSWDLIDSRGLFESTSPGGGPAEDVVELTIRSIIEHRPDVIMHVVSMPEVRALSHDLQAFERIMARATAGVGHAVPSFMVLTKADTLGNPREWPPEGSAHKAGLIAEATRYAAAEVLGADLREAEAVDAGSPMYGYRLPRHPHCKAVIPVCALAEAAEQWNIGELQEFIGLELPEDSQLHYYQALGRKDLLRKVAARLTRRFAEIAAGVGASPMPIADVFVLSPLQLLLVVMIGGLSCRPVARSTFYEYLGAIGGVGAAGLGLRMAAQQLVKLIPMPVVAQAVSGGIAGGGTFAIGRSAEAYFFAGEVKVPREMTAEAAEWTATTKAEGEAS